MKKNGIRIFVSIYKLINNKAPFRSSWVQSGQRLNNPDDFGIKCDIILFLLPKNHKIVVELENRWRK